jgi:hypothetical protein
MAWYFPFYLAFFSQGRRQLGFCPPSILNNDVVHPSRDDAGPPHHIHHLATSKFFMPLQCHLTCCHCCVRSELIGQLCTRSSTGHTHYTLNVRGRSCLYCTPIVRWIRLGGHEGRCWGRTFSTRRISQSYWGCVQASISSPMLAYRRIGPQANR